MRRTTRTTDLGIIIKEERVIKGRNNVDGKKEVGHNMDEEKEEAWKEGIMWMKYGRSEECG